MVLHMHTEKVSAKHAWSKTVKSAIQRIFLCDILNSILLTM
jgi:hypothetical protein